MSDAPIQPKRRWRTYSMRSLALLVAFLALLLGWVANEREQSRREIDAANAIIEFGGHVSFFEEIRSRRWNWISHLLGRRVEQVSIRGDNADDCFKHVSVFKELKYLSLDSDRISDLAPLANLGNLQDLRVYRATATDLAPVGGLTKLRHLVLYRTGVHDVRPLTRLTRLTDLVLTRSHVTDLTPLHLVTSLERVYLARTPVTQEQIDSLQEALPNCQIRTFNER